jgi:signal transduction histidine kinase
MRKLTTKVKVAFKFSFFSTLILILVGGMFSFFSYISFAKEMENSLNMEVEELNKDYINYEENRIIYNPVEGGKTIEKHIIDDNMSAIILNKNLDNIGIFGIYESEYSVNRSQDTLNKFLFPEVYRRVLATGKSEYIDTEIVNLHSYKTIIAPIKNGDKVVGVIQVARDVDSLKQLYNTNLMLLLLIVPGGIVSSWFMGYYLSQSAFAPLDNLIKSMKEIDTNYLSNRIDISGNEKDEIVILAKNFNEMMDRLEDGIDKQKRFIENASHEFKTPLTQAILSLDILITKINGDMNGEVQKELSLIKNDLFELNKILESLLLLAKVTGKQNIDAKIFNVKKEFEKIAERFENQLNEKKIKFVIDSEKDYKILFPIEYFHIIFSNLIDNAIKYNKDNGSITVKIIDYEYGLKISVIDSGIGMTDKEVKKITERFYRSNETLSSVKGFGLGMSIIKEIVDILTLGLEIESEKGKGTEITISKIPLN